MPTTLSDDLVTAAAAPYIEAVRVRIAPLPAERRDELLDDLRHHLQELAAEPDADLAEHLGAPDDFAEEYLASAGVEIPQRRPADVMRNAVRDRMTALADHRWSVAVLDFLPELRPAWWVARGYVPMAAALSGYEMTPFPFPDRHDDGQLPRILGTLLALGAAAVSVWLGREALAGRRARLNRWATIAGVVAVLASIVSLNQTEYADAGEIYPGDPYVDPSYSAGSLWSVEGNLITNFWIYDSQGNLVRDVYVFDQNGLPISTPVRDMGPATRIPVGPDGAPVVNRYPQEELLVTCTEQGIPQYLPVQPPVVVIPGLDPAGATAPTTAPATTAPPPSEAPTTAPPTTGTTVVPPKMGLC